MPERPVPPIAQIGSIVGAIFAALVGADPFDIRHRERAVRLLDYLAIALWILAVVLFLIAAARSTSKVLAAAIATVAVAGGLTVLALLFTAGHWSVDRDQVLILPTKAESRAIGALCHETGKSLWLRGSVQTSTLDDSFVVLDFSGSANSVSGTIRIPRDSIITIVEHPPPNLPGREVVASC
jgi:hypothetical protein